MKKKAPQAPGVSPAELIERIQTDGAVETNAVDDIPVRGIGDDTMMIAHDSEISDAAYNTSDIDVGDETIDAILDAIVESRKPLDSSLRDAIVSEMGADKAEAAEIWNTLNEMQKKALAIIAQARHILDDLLLPNEKIGLFAAIRVVGSARMADVINPQMSATFLQHLESSPDGHLVQILKPSVPLEMARIEIIQLIDSIRSYIEKSETLPGDSGA